MRFTNPTTQIVAIGQQQSVYYNASLPAPPATANIGPINGTGFLSVVVAAYGFSNSPLSVRARFYEDAAHTQFAGDTYGNPLGTTVADTTFVELPLLTPYFALQITYTNTVTILSVYLSSAPANVRIAANGSNQINGTEVTNLNAPNDTADHTLVFANVGRLDAALYNNTNQNVRVLLNDLTSISATAYTVLMVPGAYYELPKSSVGVYQGEIHIQWATATTVGNFLATESS